MDAHDICPVYTLASNTISICVYLQNVKLAHNPPSPPPVVSSALLCCALLYSPLPSLPLCRLRGRLSSALLPLASPPPPNLHAYKPPKKASKSPDAAPDPGPDLSS